MSIGIYARETVEGHILAGIVIAVRGAQAQGGNAQFLAGALALAQHNALAAEIDWPELLETARHSLGAGEAVLDAALQLRAG